MNLIKKISIAMVAAGSMATAFAESITFGVEIAPVASLVVRDGVLRAPAAMGFTGPTANTANADDAAVVGGFLVMTNMPKWNVYFTLANNGNFVSQSGKYLMTTAGLYLPLGEDDNAAITAGKLWLKFPATNQIIAEDDISGTGIAVAAINTVVDAEVSNTVNSLTAVLAAATTACTGPAACTDNGWLYGTGETVANFDIAAVIDNTVAATGVAGTYTETLYLTLVSAY